MTAILDDLDARPGSTVSLLRTIIGLYLRRLGGWIAIADLVQLMDDLGVPAARARTGVVRVKQKGLLIADRDAGIGYRLNPDAAGMLKRGDRRIFAVRQMADDESWCLVSFSIPESHRDVRHQLRRRLQWIGCGVVSPALWICPAYLSDEVQEILIDLGIRSYATVFLAEQILHEGTLKEAINQWWDLPRLRAEHLEFQKTIEPINRAVGVSERSAFSDYIRLVDAWRILPYVDPGLPASLLPDDWPGRKSISDFMRLSDRLAEPAWMHVQRSTELR
ncbi:Transcriptional repressor PaaX [Microbacterium lemovicicum]|uniref:Transcriptional repressor PaaX n=1 Tax=Microbacterium lemovicicum TaxID=1072463 RepID=A0A3Q9IY42_9MICO|nr:PaaX family transcriptional regulator C-terminal domain-containing protein [Microbacterium lemovicicum]AZS35701.1 Transcriptional repressor PaaX [Microbacterium lemovicicum]